MYLKNELFNCVLTYHCIIIVGEILIGNGVDKNIGLTPHSPKIMGEILTNLNLCHYLKLPVVVT